MKRSFANIATVVDQFSGRPTAFVVALLIIAVWAIAGPLFRFSDTWQLIINTGTTIIYISHGLRHSEHAEPGRGAIQAKLDELIRVSAARNALIVIETLTQDEIEEIRATCAAKAGRARNGSRNQTIKKWKARDEP